MKTQHVYRRSEKPYGKHFYDSDIFLCVQLNFILRGYIKKLPPLTCLSPGQTVSDCDVSCVLLSSYNNPLYFCDD